MRRVESTGRRSDARTTALKFFGWVTLSLLTAFVGPFSTFDTMTLEFRVVYWGGVVGSAVLLSEVVQWVVAQYDVPGPLHADLMGSALMAPSFGLAITIFNDVALGHSGSFVSALGTNILTVLLVCLGIVIVRGYVRALAGETQEPTAAADDAPEEKPLPGFLRDIDPEIAASVHWIEADDHYLKVHGQNGSTRVLMRFRDALEEISDLPGLQVHRSHWVRIEAVTEVRPDGRRHVAVLPCGAKVPVSRSYLPDLQAAGLMDCDEASAPQ